MQQYDFIGREKELARLDKMYDSQTQEATLIYGRRRVGKSELIKQFVQQHVDDAIYFECKQTTESNNVATLGELVSDKMQLPPLGFANIEQLLDFVFKQACARKIILVLDEYPYLQKIVTGLDSILQALIDKYKNHSQIKLILCGSFVDTMKKLLLRHNPLYGRISTVLNLKPMNYLESANFYPSFSRDDKVRLYSVFGGIPYYNSLIDEHLSVKENIMELLALPGARLEDEVSMYLSTELAKINSANEVFEALTRGFSKFSDILSQSHLSSSALLSDVLKKLMLMDMVDKEAPINDANNKKKAGYFISDNMSMFFYRYIFRYASQRRIMNPEIFYQRYIESDFEQFYVPKRFEDICKQFLILKNQQGEMDEPFEAIGKYYYDLPKEHKNGEFDVVTKDDRGYAFYEAKFRDAPVSNAMIEKEIQQVNSSGLYCYRYGFFSKSGYEEISRSDVVKYTLDNLYPEHL
ncbi:ATP-binding protein [Selenomonas sp. KH1T6]|uniref:ATP-binding protein n=1 Tax=Selenomonas sp. KH1T6 TaxID=3158784 RepID=UPI0008A7E495|nr:hypothetical protein SAMN05216583_10761 [Selenomonas ruminantium]